MAAARYWRIVAVRTYGGGDLALSELHLYGSAGRLDASAAVTSSHPPVVGALANLQDDNLATVCGFAGADVRSGGFWLAWDLGSAIEVTGVRPGAANQLGAYVEGLLLQYLDAGTWVSALELGRFIWPGANALDVAPATSADPHLSKVALLLHLDGASDSTA